MDNSFNYEVQGDNIKFYTDDKSILHVKNAIIQPYKKYGVHLIDRDNKALSVTFVLDSYNYTIKNIMIFNYYQNLLKIIKHTSCFMNCNEIYSLNITNDNYNIVIDENEFIEVYINDTKDNIDYLGINTLQEYHPEFFYM